MRNLSIDPIVKIAHFGNVMSVKIAHFGNVMSVAKVSDFYNGVYGENLCLLSDPTEMSFMTTPKTLTLIM